MPPKVRSACDRCHSQKLRCTRKEGSARCERCLKLNQRCRYSSRAARGSLNSSSNALTSALDTAHESNSAATQNMNWNSDVWSDLDFDSYGSPLSLGLLPLDIPIDRLWATFDCPAPILDGTLVDASPVTIPASLSLDHNEDTTSCNPTPSATERLSSLNIALYNCAEQLPSASGRDLRTSRKATIFAIEELFGFTQEYISILQSYLHDTHELQGSATTLDTDEATTAVIFSAHCRLTNLYMSLFKMMQACIEHSLAPRLDADWTVILPPLQVGSLASAAVRVDARNPIDSAATSSMYMLMIVMLSTRLWESLEQLTSSEYSPRTSTSRDSMIAIMWFEISKKTQEVLNIIAHTKQMLGNYPEVTK